MRHVEIVCATYSSACWIIKCNLLFFFADCILVILHNEFDFDFDSDFQ